MKDIRHKFYQRVSEYPCHNFRNIVVNKIEYKLWTHLNIELWQLIEDHVILNWVYETA